MSVLAELLGTYAPGHALESGGADFVFARIDKATRAALTAKYFERARKAVYSIKAELTPQEFDRQLSHVTDAWRRGVYDFPVGESLAWFLSEDGLPELVAVLTGRPRKECELLCAGRQQEVYHVVWCVIAESSPALKKTLLEREGDPAVLAMFAPILSSRTRTSNCTPPGSGTSSPCSPRTDSDPTSTRG